MSQLSRKELRAYCAEATRINRADLESEYARVAADYGYVANIYADAVEVHEMAKIQADAVASSVREELRSELGAADGRYPTERRLDTLCAADKTAQGAKAYLAQALREKTYLHRVLEALGTKRDMLVSLGATQRQERQAAGLAT